ncbi:MAG: purine-nucleoside phosphorylase [Chloroflexi bacterium]|nr:MAG: purine-nucleoside phosphorylase [Chloroflexota bacterium]
MTVQTRDFFSFSDIQQAADYIRAHTSHQPEIGLILGSGLSPLAEEIDHADRIPYRNIPHFPVSGVEGHAGMLVIGHLAGQPVLVMQGRTHFYEGYTVQHITLPVRVMQALGVKTLVVTNAAGGINPNFQAGDLMLIVDHINMLGFGGANPLRGPNLSEFGPRFPSMTHPYDRQLRDLAKQAADRLNIPLREGVYACLAGPSFETPAEIRFLRTIGADAVGMSTVPEVIVANHGGMRVLGVSSITNVAVASLDSERETTHQEVLETGKLIVPRLMALLKEVLAAMA